MERLREMRELAGLTQIGLARRAGVSRMRLQLAEAGEITLRQDESKAVNSVLRGVIERQAATLQNVLGTAKPAAG